VGWSLKPRMTADIAIDALTMVTEYGMTCSMSRKGNCWDNAQTESWFKSFKKERCTASALPRARI